jgi:hypothetical protein
MAERIQWEYQLYAVAKNRKHDSLFEALDDLGKMGWEVAAFIEQDDGRALILKRPRGWG